jgi:hypothetical protein
LWRALSYRIVVRGSAWRGDLDVSQVDAGVEHDRDECGGPARADSSSPVDGPPYCGRKRDQDDLGALAAHAQHPVAMFLAEVTDVGASSFEDPQAEQPEYGHQREVVRVRRLPGGGQRSLELQG